MATSQLVRGDHRHIEHHIRRELAQQDRDAQVRNELHRDEDERWPKRQGIHRLGQSELQPEIAQRPEHFHGPVLSRQPSVRGDLTREHRA